jgi:two-component sensor histidine kinase
MLQNEGEGESCRFPDLAERVLEPFGVSQRFYLTGDSVALPPASCAPLALVPHELAANALQYGALSNAEGEILLTWGPVAGEEGQLMIRWEEWGGPPVVKPRRRGLGSHLLERQPGLADLSLAFHPHGVACDIRVNLSTPPAR